jgi:hypothetical protein
MKPNYNLASRSALAAILALAAAGMAIADTTTVFVTPTTIGGVSGGAVNECKAVGTYAYAWKINEGNGEEAPNGSYTTTAFQDGHTNTISIANSDGQFFDWSASPNTIGAVLVKASTYINVFDYVPQASADTGLYSPINANNGEHYDISHVTFCWNKDEQTGCYEHNSAWSQGPRYNNRGNWAMYTAYTGTEEVTYLMAGQHTVAGEVVIEPSGAGMVTITIDLGDMFYFGSKNSEKLETTVHIQGYSKAPSGNPAPGLFSNHYVAQGQLLTVELPAFGYYGIHANVMEEVACE